MSLATMDEFGRHFAESRVAVVSLLVSLTFLFCAIFVPVIAPTNPYDLSQLQLADALKPVGSPKVVPGEELRVRVTVANGAATFEDLPEASAIKAIAAEACGEKCLDVGVKPADVALESLQIRGLPPGLSVEGASKHPVQPWWTIAAPDDGKARILAEGALPSDFSFLAIVKSAPQETGFVFSLGTDSFGRDMLSAILYGIRISVIVGLVAAGTAMVLGIGLGLLAAWMGGTVDAVIMRAVDFMLGFPALLVGLAVLAILGNGVDKVVFASLSCSGPITRARPGRWRWRNWARNMWKRPRPFACRPCVSCCATSCLTVCRKSSSCSRSTSPRQYRLNPRSASWVLGCPSRSLRSAC
jgi:peptide/nickel transport system permease protein